MITTRQELAEYSKRRFLNLGQAEIDYFQNIILFILYSKSNTQLIFKGGTALQKCYGLERFSKDLDFNASKKPDFEEIIRKGLKELFLEFEIESNSHLKGDNFVIRIKGPLYNGNRSSMCKIMIDLSYREETSIKPKIITLAQTINEIPSFDVIAMDMEEIFAEKIRAILTRNKSRDIYDIFFLLNKGVNQNKNLIMKKLDHYKIIFTKQNLLKKIKSEEKAWKIEMEPLIKESLDFDSVFKNIKSKLKN